MIKVVFAGSGDFAVPILKALAIHTDVKLVITQPPRPAGKSKKMTPTPVHLLTNELQLPCVTPLKLADANEQIANIKPDILIVTDYGQMVKQSTFQLSPKGIINVHPSLLPIHRGPSPVLATIMSGDNKTGVSVMLIDEQMDHGPLLGQSEIILKGTESASQLELILANIGADLLINLLPLYLNGSLLPTEQNHELATFCKLIKKTDGQLTGQESAAEVSRMIRAYNPWPGVWFEIAKGAGEICKIIGINDINVIKMRSESLQLLVINKHLYLTLKDEAVEVTRLQISGRKPCSAVDYINGLSS